MAWVHVQTPKAQAFDTPIIGPHLARIGRVIDLWSEPCSPDAYLWVYGFFHHLPTLFGSITKPDWIDIPAKGRHRGRKKGRGVRGFMNLIGQLDAVQPPAGRWVAFRITAVFQQAAFYFIVADATEDFLINWMSTAYMYDPACPVRPAFGVKEDADRITLTEDGWNSITMPTIEANDMDSQPGYFICRKAGTYRFSYYMTAQPYAPDPGEITGWRVLYTPTTGPQQVLGEETPHRDRGNPTNTITGGTGIGTGMEVGDELMLQYNKAGGGRGQYSGNFQLIEASYGQPESDP